MGGVEAIFYLLLFYIEIIVFLFQLSKKIFFIKTSLFFIKRCVFFQIYSKNRQKTYQCHHIDRQKKIRFSNPKTDDLYNKFSLKK